MKVTLPDKITGTRDALFVLEVEFPVSSTDRTVQVDASGPVEPLDLSGSSRGGTYRIPVGLERLHVPMRVTEEGAADARVTVKCTAGPEAGESAERALRLEAVPVGATAGGWKKWAAVAALLLGVGAGAFGVSKLIGGDDTISDYRGMSQEVAEQAIRDAGYQVRVTWDTAPTEDDVNVVFRHLPGPNEPAPEDGVVEIVLGRSAAIGLPVVRGELAADAEAALSAAGYVVLTDFEDDDDPANAGRVIAQIPEAGTVVPPGNSVTIIVANAPSTIAMPALVGMERDAALSALEGLGLLADVRTDVGAPAASAGLVLRQVPEPGIELARGATVTVHVAAGGGTPQPTPPQPVPPQPIPPQPVPPQPVPPQPVPPQPVPPQPVPPQPTPPQPTPPQPTPPQPTPPQPTPPPVATPEPLVPDAEGMFLIPDMTGWDQALAQQVIREAGLVPVPMREPPPTPEQTGRILRQRPQGGEKRGPRAMIFLYIGEGAPIGPQPTPPQPTPPQPVPPQPVPPQPVPPQPVPPQPVPPQPVPPQPVPPQPVPPQPTPPQPTPPQPVPPQPGPVASAQMPVPDIVGMMREKAEGVVRQAGFRSRIVLKVTAFPADGMVLSQDPGPGQLLIRGGEMVLEVARTPPDAQIPVPSVVGKDRVVAERLLRSAGFLVNVTLGGGAPQQQGLVSDQAPVGNALARRRTWVEIVVVQGTGQRRTARGGPPQIGAVIPPRAPVPDSSSALPDGPAAVPPGVVTMPPPTPRGPDPIPPVPLPPRDGARTASVPNAVGMNATDAVTAVLHAGLIPIVEVDRSSAAPAGRVLRQDPATGTSALPGDLVRIAVSVRTGTVERNVDLPTAIGAEVEKARRMFSSSRSRVEVLQVRVPNHPYAGTGRVAAQYPVSSVPRSLGDRVFLWIVTR